MKKEYSKPNLELVEFASATKIALNEVSQSKGVLDFNENQGEATSWENFFQ